MTLATFDLLARVIARNPAAFSRFDGLTVDHASRYRGTLIGAGGYTLVTGEKAIDAGDVNLVAMGKPYIANPDLVERLLNGWPLATPDRDTFYGDWGAKGYTDYPTYQPDAAHEKQQATD